MPNFYSPDLGSDPDSPFARDETGKLVRRMYWLDMGDASVVLAMTQGLGAPLRLIINVPISRISDEGI